MTVATGGHRLRYAVVYGGIAGAIVIAVISATIALDLPSHATSMWVGYLVMLTGLSLIFVATKRYRDVECGGVIRFGPAFRLGLAIAAVAALIYTIGWEIYLATASGDFMAEMTKSTLEGMRAAGSSEAAIAAREAKMQTLAESYKNPLFRLPLTFIEIFPVGMLVALVSAALLRNPKLLPARAG
jgi:uncharacterized membrane protein